MRSLFLIQKGPRPDHCGEHVRWYPVVVCGSSRVARLLAGDTADGCSVWQNLGWKNDGQGLLLVRWRGLDVDYGPVLRSGILPDGTVTGFHHRADEGTWRLLKGAVWWSTLPMPKWLEKLGVCLSPDSLTDRDVVTHRRIEEDEAHAKDETFGVRPFGYRCPLALKALADSPTFRELLLPGFEAVPAEAIDA